MRPARKVNTPGSAVVQPADESSAESSSGETSAKKRPTTYMTKSKKVVTRKIRKQVSKQQFDAAISDWLGGKYESLPNCAAAHKVNYKTLHMYITHPEKSFTGKGRKSEVLSADEESRLTEHVKWRASVGCGVTWTQLQLLVQVRIFLIILSF